MARDEASPLMGAFHEHYDSLLGTLAGRLGDLHRASEVVHDTWLRLASLGRPASPVENPRAYVFRVASNIAIDLLRRERRLGAPLLGDGLTEDIRDEAPSPEAALQGRQRLHQLDAALAELPANVRRALLLARVDGLSHARIAAELGVSESMVAKYLARGLKYCRAAMDAEG